MNRYTNSVRKRTAAGTALHTFITLFKTEGKLVIRGGDMILFGIIFPAAIMLLIGFISGPETLQADFAGIVMVGICASGLMGVPLTFASYRHDNILKRFKVTPVSPLMLLGAVFAVQVVFGVVSGLLVFLIAGSGFGMTLTGSPLRCVAVFFFVMFSIYSLGFLIASLVPNVKTANMVCTLVYFPSLFLSGATVPYDIMPKGLQIFSSVFPMTQGIKLMRSAVLGIPTADELWRIALLTLISAVSITLSLKCFRWSAEPY